MPDSPAETEKTFPLLVGAQVEAYTLIVRRETSTEMAAKLRAYGHTRAANLVDEQRDFTELSRSLAAVPGADPHTAEHKAGCRSFACQCGCDPTQDCQDCCRCVCWRAECCAQQAIDQARQLNRSEALRQLLDGMGIQILRELRQTAADAEEAALRRALSHRTHRLVPNTNQYSWAEFHATDSKLCMGHADYSQCNVELYAPAQDVPALVVDLDDGVLSALLGELAELLRPEEGAPLRVDLMKAHS
ncbi:hypothetical protein ACWF9B_00635 [Streptomyces sp. NPDC055089]